jgi:cellulose synthase/poly-beta-1,6-N-acetylglucosamine synthase-like glycosyltransferase
MTTLAVFTLWLSLAFVLYVYLGFPVILVVVAAIRQRRVLQQPITPSVSLLIAAYNEEACIAERIENALQMDYPRERLEILVASDGCTDDTEAIVERYAEAGVRLLRFPRRGKVAALNDAVLEARGDVLVFSDANTMVERGALRALVRNFADPAVGGVAAYTGYRIKAGSESSSHGENLYWRYDTWLKGLESRSGSVVAAHGGLYAIRRELYLATHDTAVTDDFVISSGVVELGRRLVFEPAARAWEFAVPSADREFSRRIRIMTAGLRGTALRWRLLNPLRYGFYSLVLLTHKVLRRLVPVSLLLLLAATVLLRDSGDLYRHVLEAQTAFYGLALIGLAARGSSLGRSKLLYVPFFYCMANAAALLSLLKFLRGHRIVSWEPHRHEVPAIAAGSAARPAANSR